MKPYKEFKPKDNVMFRTFDENISEGELVWHRHKKDRIVTALHQTDWKVQIDNKLPEALTEVFIPKDTYHRVIKGTKTLTVKIVEK